MKISISKNVSKIPYRWKKQIKETGLEKCSMCGNLTDWQSSYQKAHTWFYLFKYLCKQSSCPPATLPIVYMEYLFVNWKHGPWESSLILPAQSVERVWHGRHVPPHHTIIKYSPHIIHDDVIMWYIETLSSLLTLCMGNKRPPVVSPHKSQ